MVLSLVLLLIVSIDSSGSLSGVLECNQNSDCLAGGATCKDNLCECNPGYTFSTNGTMCLQHVTRFHGKCVDKAQCAWLLGDFACTEGLCECNSGWRWWQGRCQEVRGLGEACTLGVECYNGYDHFAMSCLEGTCGCSEGYYLRGGYDCRPEAKEVGDQCALDGDCRFENGTCQNAKCQIVSNTTTTTKETLNQKKSTGANVKDVAIDQTCLVDSDCAQIPNAACSPLTKKCICQRGYFELEYNSTFTQCVGEIGVDVGCAVDEDCLIKPGKCIDGACLCAPFRFYGKDMRKCHKSMTQTNWNCTSSEWCYAFGTHAICNKDRVCTCADNYFLDSNAVCQENGNVIIEDECGECDISKNFHCVDGNCACRSGHREENGACLPNIGSECSSSFPCTLDHAQCSNNECACEEDYVAANDKVCLRVAEGLEGDCEADVQCSERTLNSVCSEESKCACASAYVNRNGTCFELKTIGSYCGNLRDCSVVMGGNVLCRNSKCQCSFDMEATEDGSDCRRSSGRVSLPNVLGVLAAVTATGLVQTLLYKHITL